MNLVWRSATRFGAALACGALAWVVLGSDPVRDATNPVPGETWALPIAAVADLGKIEEVWKQRHPWGAPPAAAAEQAPLPEPRAIPVGTALTDGKLFAVFMAPDGSLARLKPGDTINGGGRLETVTRFHVSWTDSRGTKYEQELLADPLPTQVSLQ